MSLYADFARVYDAVMDQSLYDQWLAFSRRHFPKGTRSVLELACGSGELAVRFDRAGYAVMGLDLSEEMLTLAKHKLPARDFVLGDMRDFAFGTTFDAITCYSDSLCYLSDLTEVQQAVNCAWSALANGGVFLFDVHSTYQIDAIFPDYSYHENAEDFAFLWDSYKGDEPHSIVHELSFFIQEADGRFVRRDEVHKERTYPVEDYLSVLGKFGKVSVYADFTDKAPTGKSQRLFLVCEK